MKTLTSSTFLVMCCLVSVGCDGPLSPPVEEATPQGGAQAPEDEGLPVCPEVLPYADEVVSFSPGDDAGFGQLDMPDIVLGPPAEGPPTAGSLDVVSLGVGGEIVLSFSGRVFTDGPGVDLIIWENVFWVGGDEEAPYAELGEVAVSEDGETWIPFTCEAARDDGFDPGCAGWRPRQDFDPCGVVPLVHEEVGGDGFDLADIGVSSARYVRVRDAAMVGGSPSAGFDLDAVGAVYLAP